MSPTIHHETPTKPASPARFLALDGLRGLCALMILAFHISSILFHHRLGHMQVAVEIFFVLSGFVIALNYEQKLRDGLGIRAFLLRRLRRLAPIYWLGTLVCFCVFLRIEWLRDGLSGILKTILVLPGHLLLIPHFATDWGQEFPLNGVAWSLFAECVTYVLYAQWLIRLKNRSLFLTAVAIFIFTIITGLFAPYSWHHIGILRFGLTQAAADFSFGVLIYRCHSNNLFRRLPVLPPWLICLVWLGIALIPAYPLSETYDLLMALLICPAIVALLVRAETAGRKAPAGSRRAGWLSYPLYTTHFALMLYVFYLIPEPHTWHIITAVIPLALLMAWALAVLNDRIQARMPVAWFTPQPGKNEDRPPRQKSRR